MKPECSDVYIGSRPSLAVEGLPIPEVFPHQLTFPFLIFGEKPQLKILHFFPLKGNTYTISRCVTSTAYHAEMVIDSRSVLSIYPC